MHESGGCTVLATTAGTNHTNCFYARSCLNNTSKAWKWSNVWTIVGHARNGHFTTRGQWARLENEIPTMPLEMQHRLRDEFLKIFHGESVRLLFHEVTE